MSSRRIAQTDVAETDVAETDVPETVVAEMDVSETEVTETNEADGCPSDVKPRRMGPTSYGLLSERHPSVPFVLVFPVSEMDVPETAGGETVRVLCEQCVWFE